MSGLRHCNIQYLSGLSCSFPCNRSMLIETRDMWMGKVGRSGTAVFLDIVDNRRIFNGRFLLFTPVTASYDYKYLLRRFYFMHI